MNEKELAEVREKWAREAYWQFGGNAEYTTDQPIPLLPIEISNKAYALIDQILNTPITIEGGVCPDCKGKGGWEGRPDDPEFPTMCEGCKGTGKLPDKTFTIKEAIGDYNRRGSDGS